jgi:hypothetical protein
MQTDQVRRRKIHVVEENAVYGLDSLRAALSLRRGTLPREIKLGRLRCSRRAGRVFILGSWVLQWLEAGAVRPAPDAAAS